VAISLVTALALIVWVTIHIAVTIDIVHNNSGLLRLTKCFVEATESFSPCMFKGVFMCFMQEQKKTAKKNKQKKTGKYVCSNFSR